MSNTIKNGKRPTAATTALQRVELLSAREFEVLTHLLLGGTELEIGATLGIKLNTLHANVKQIFRKMDTRSRPQLMAELFLAMLQLAGRSGRHPLLAAISQLGRRALRPRKVAPVEPKKRSRRPADKSRRRRA